ncbi:hypothetical protein [Actinomadura sp. 7K534]|uniref:hypothetical protein n=1 Tax=Actinomadura sp. 7K534 TaxID=2530366 RepID=UPI001047186F|nr:hypothetical protein [Actinomadura sp. 7K534]TDB96427.1 hypothetical protein E1266_10015 [Actinomadura sp. 7K534]
MTPTLIGRIQTRILLAATVGVLWTALIAPFLPDPTGVTASMWTVGMRYAIAFTGLLLTTVYGLVWEHLYHRLQQRRWDKDWPSVFGLLTILNEAPLAWLLVNLFFPVMSGPSPDMLNLHNGGIAGPKPGMFDPTPDMLGPLDTSGWGLWDSPFLPAFIVHISTTWLIMWLAGQGPLRVILIRWRFEGGRVVRSRLADVPAPGARPGLRAAEGAGIPVRETSPSTEIAALARSPRTARGNGSPAPAPNGNPLDGNLVDRDLVDGGMCGHGHLGSPGSRYCGTCGRPLQQPNGTRILGRRPPLGVLIFDDGTMHVLDGEVRLGLVEETGALTAGHREEIPAASALADVRTSGWRTGVSSEVHRIALELPGGGHADVAPGEVAWLVPGAEFTIGPYRIRYESPYQPPDPGPDGAGDAGAEWAPGDRAYSQYSGLFTHYER